MICNNLIDFTILALQIPTMTISLYTTLKRVETNGGVYETVKSDFSLIHFNLHVSLNR